MKLEFFLQTFKPLVDTVGLFKSKFQPVEFLVDLRLDFQDYNKLRKIWVRPLSRLALETFLNHFSKIISEMGSYDRAQLQHERGL